MDRRSSSSRRAPWRSPHARGDGPLTHGWGTIVLSESPRTWGWTADPWLGNHRSFGVPTHVGMDRAGVRRNEHGKRSPHARGDGPPGQPNADIAVEESPRTWGWTVRAAKPRSMDEGVPTHVGMDRCSRNQPPTLTRSPHARGDGPAGDDGHKQPMPESPRTWGWTAMTLLEEVESVGVPTHVGMDRTQLLGVAGELRSPHARGDGPASEGAKGPLYQESPRTWGWTATPSPVKKQLVGVPTHVGMDRGDIAPAVALPTESPRTWGWTVVGRLGTPDDTESPRTWGWTEFKTSNAPLLLGVPTHVGMDRNPRKRAQYACGVPTHVGMDRKDRWHRRPHYGSPHARGDGPQTPSSWPRDYAESPRTWGWTAQLLSLSGCLLGVPTHVGMDRARLSLSPRNPRSPHARGDGPSG